MGHYRSMLIAVAALMLSGAAMAQSAPATATPTAVATAPTAGAAAPVVTSAASPAPAPVAASAPAATPAATKATPRFYTPTPGIGQPTPGAIGLQTQVTALGQQAANMNDYLLLPIIIAICALVLVLLLWVVFRYRKGANPTPSRTSHNTILEVAWTVIPVLVLLFIAVPSIKLLAAQYDTPKPDITIKVIGHQWYWSYQYPDNGNFEVVSNILTDAQDDARGLPRQLGVDERMVVPAGAVVKVIVTSDDVIHSFAMPAFWMKMDAVPGRLNETWFKVDRPGVYYGECSELCGARHGFMPIAIEVVTPAQFRQWIAAKGGTMGGKPTTSDATVNSPISNPSVAATPASVQNTNLENATAVAPATSQAATATN